MVEAPWTDEQVAALNRWQGTGWVHPFTCGGGNRTDDAHAAAGVPGGTLLATNRGWVCKGCDYRQSWAHGFMFGEPPPDPRTYFAEGA